MARTGYVWIAVALASSSAGCQFNASASGEAKTGGESKFESNASMQTGSGSATTEGSAESVHYQAGKLEYEGEINFEYNRAEIKTDATTRRTLSSFKKFLDQNPGVKISVEGHTDSRGSEDYNRKLSDRRAASVRDWLTKEGISGDRITSIGKGEDDPQVPEPDECNNKVPKDTKNCEGPWGTNRRVLFRVTEGAETIQQTAAPAKTAEQKPAPEPAPTPAPAEEHRCLIGPRVGLLGPNSWLNVAGAVQPCVDWLELSLGIGLGFGRMNASSGATESSGNYWSLTVPLRARIWPFRVHSPIADLGIGFTHYRISSSAGSDFDYSRKATPFIAHLGLGYGYRPNGPEPGLRLSILVGALFHLNGMPDSSVDRGAGLPVATANSLKNDLDGQGDDLTHLEPYAELAAEWLF